MISFEQALEITLGSASFIGSENVDIAQAANRVLAQHVESDTDLPPFNRATMDGFACRRQDLSGKLEIIEQISAGYVPRKTIGQNQCAKIMTGAVVPEGADCVIMKEYVETLTDNAIRFTGEKTSGNICKKGEDVKTGDIILDKGTILKPQHIAVLATLGVTKPLVAKRPKVAIIATGSELVDPALKPELSKIRNSNSFQLAAQVENAGAVPANYGITKDAVDEIDRQLKAAMNQNDIIIFSGGVSVGDFDYVPDVLKQNNVEILFEKIAVKPGKPVVFGLSGGLYFFGLPGNPVSTFVIFELLVRPFIYKLMGNDYKPLNVAMPLEKQLVNKKAERQKWLPVKITDKATVRLIDYHGSGHLTSLCNADGLINVAVGVREIEKNTLVPVRLI